MLKSPRSSALQAYLRLLGNPYASLELAENFKEGKELSDAYSALQNPYAKLSSGEEVDRETGTPSRSTKASIVEALPPSLSKVQFRARCNRIFKQYIPALEKGRLRAHHRDFILRNESCSSKKRYRLVMQLEKYDLSKVEGIQAHFNRERDVLTEKKLKEVERLAESEE